MSARGLPLLLVVLALAGGVVASALTLGGPADEGKAPGSVSPGEVLGRAIHCEDAPSPAAGAPASGCAHLVYVWSESMPLSIEGVREVRRAARSAGLGLSVVAESELIEPAADARVEALRLALVEAGATVHFPSLVVMVDGLPVGNALLGYKRAEAVEDLVERRLAAVRDLRADRVAATAPGATARPGAEVPVTPAPLGAPEVPARPGGSPPDIRVVWTHVVEPPPGAFFRRVPGTTYITFDQRRTVHVRNVATGRQFQGPGWIDFVPTPDGRLFVTPGPSHSGLEFYLASDVMEAGEAGSAEAVEAFRVDRLMNDQYPSVGILLEDGGNARTRYRILVSWFSGLAFRDYEVRWKEEGPPEVEALAEKQTACPGLDLSTPILSKDGREIAARDEATGTTKVFRLRDDASCSEVLDLGRQTSKVGFSDDGRLIAYSSPERSSRFSGTRSWTYVLDRTSMETVRVPDSESAGLVIPELVGPDSLLIAVKEGARSQQSEFRLLCCLR